MQAMVAKTQDDLRWDDVKVVLAIMRNKNLASAAQALAIDQSTASRRINSLRKAARYEAF